MSENYSIKYPRRVWIRRFLVWLGRLVVPIVARPQITGLEKFPQKGPVLVVANHSAAVEIVLMAVYVPWIIEVIGSGDIPIDPRYQWVVKLYDFIPIKRGSVDRKGLTMALDVLKQGGAVGIFPEGGIWDKQLRQGRTGISWLSQKSNAPIVPIGFGGLEGALGKVFRGERPVITMNVGDPLPPVNGREGGQSRKEALAEGVDRVMAAIEALIPDEDKKRVHIEEEHFDFKVIVENRDGSPVPVPETLRIDNPEALGEFFFRPVILDAMARNLNLPVKVLQRIDIAHEPGEIARAISAILKYLEDNPQFFNYRFGYEKGHAMEEGLIQLREVTRYAITNGYTVTLKPTHRVRYADQEEVVEETPGAAHEI